MLFPEPQPLPMDIFQTIRENKLANLKQLLSTDVKLLASRDARDTTPLVLASYLDNAAATKLIVDAGADLDAQGMTGTALMGVCFKGHLELARYLLEAGADPNIRHANGSTALIFAAMFNQEAIIDLLLEKGADIAVKDANGLTAADHARGKGLNELADKLS